MNSDIRKISIPQLVQEGLHRNTQPVAVAGKLTDTWKTYSVSEFRVAVTNAALGFLSLGIKKGDRVALHSENRPEWLIVDQALLSIGVITVPIYVTQPYDQIKYIIENSESVAYVVSTGNLYKGFQPFEGQVSSLKHTIFMDPPEGRTGLDDLIAKGNAYGASHPGAFEKALAGVGPDDMATYIYTSGTTGVPKGVMLTHFNVSSNVQASLDALPFDVEGDRGHKMLSFLPLAHIFERMVSYMYFSIGYPIYYVATVDTLVNDIQYVKPICLASVPRVLEKIHAGFYSKSEEMRGLQRKLVKSALKLAETYECGRPFTGMNAIKWKIFNALVYKKFRAALGGNIKVLLSGGAALSPFMQNFFNGIGILCGQGYGLTETSPVLTVFRKDKLKAGSSGLPIRNVEIKIAEDGEILAKGPNIMQGYYKMPEATAEVITPDGWFHTGDIGHIDKDGLLYITDRKKALFKLSTGKYVAPQHIENKLCDHMGIEQCMVIGNGQKFCAALIVPDYAYIKKFAAAHNEPFNDEDRDNDPLVRKLVLKAVDDVNKTVPHWEAIKQYKLLKAPFSIDGGELTPKMSIKRAFVMKKYAAQVEEIYKE
jgi:long-chain acyl-CoA synthetase